MPELFELSLLEAQKLLQKGEVSAESLVASCISRINATEPSLGALLARRDEEALEEARAMDKMRPADFSDKPLWGIPVTVKDALTLKGLPTTAASKILEGFIPPYDAMVVQKLKDAGAVILAKNNMDEFAMGSTTEHSAYRATANPWDLSRVPGGSSGGSAASVAACQCFASLGSDTGGSIRQPASLCGCVGIKPTYGRVSRYGLLAYASSFDQVGPLARTVEDAALMLQVIAGHDGRDSTSSPVPVPDYAAAMAAQEDLSGLTLGLPREFFGHEGLDKGVSEACEKAVEAARGLGAKVAEVSLPHTEYAIASYYILAAAEASSNLARYDGVRYGHRTAAPRNLEDMYTSSRTEGFGPEVQRRILLGSYVLSAGYYDAYYRKAAQVRRLIRQDYLDALEKCDMLLAPVSPVPAWQLGHMSEDPLQMYFMDIFTLSLNLAGLPGLSIPVGLSEGLPVGMQLLGRAFDEGRLFLAGDKLTRALGTHNLRAPL
ncbi:Asp-tRNA(Asn)/Glu-tRNA(Gln) amidotransferase subunit GatA [Mailhella massiliensis]|uniref:Glutamyl-tRNA(Gln) amidotransferase subunit A n=1 Tax=Mailhella massiliensis TaxID=1903261 RepID=A0A921DTQ2_9BACT|nr:Asp-tRNA(Asn)/Glu-tRNA(Gln) amidotransferase subunit GatA [Mailhella massiliensis]HJD98327.1 Asp-tRNA(Asn)/Glu-tRNA(Gln) amidotransferase subunit GatA [Mailhella massiliensis]